MFFDCKSNKYFYKFNFEWNNSNYVVNSLVTYIYLEHCISFNYLN